MPLTNSLCYQAWNPEGGLAKVWGAVGKQNCQSTAGGAEEGCSWGYGNPKEAVGYLHFAGNFLL